MNGMNARLIKRKGLICAIKSSVIEYYSDDLVTLAIFGSYAGNRATPESDIDMLIIADNLPDGRMKRILQFDAVEESILKSYNDKKELMLSPIIKLPQEIELGSPLFWDMTDCLEILFDRNNYFSIFLHNVKQRLIENGAQKVVRGNAWYWILKKDFVPGEVFTL